MGYESRIMVVNKMDNYGESLCIMNLSCMEFEFKQIFKDEVDFDVYFQEAEDYHDDDLYPTKEDKYGNTLKYTTINNVINYLKYNTSEYCRRADVLLQTLRAYQEAFGDHLLVVHFGY